MINLLTYDGKKFGIVQASKVGPTVAEDIKTNALGGSWSYANCIFILAN
jgi:hypothetical protein